MTDRQVPADPIHAEAIVAQLAAAAGVPIPTRAADVVAMLRQCGYDVTPRTPEEFREKGYFSAPDGEWDAMHVYVFAASLECRRRWLPTPNPYHDAKKSGARLLVEQSQAAGLSGIADLDEYSVEDLLIQLTTCDARERREVLYEAVRAKLAGFEE